MTDVICETMSAAVADTLDDTLRKTTIFRRLPADDRQRLAAVTTTRAFEKGEHLFHEGDAQLLDTLCLEMKRHRHQPVTVGVGLDDAHDGHAHVRPDRRGVVRQRVEIDPDARRAIVGFGTRVRD